MEWQLKTMADIAEPVNGIVDGPFGSNLKKSDYIDDSENGIPVLTTKNLHGDYSKDSVRYISTEKYETLKRSTVFPGDILVAKIGSIGTCGIYPLSCKNALIPANLLKITVLPTVDRKYVYYYIQSRGFQEKIKAISTATAQPAFNVTKFRKLHIPIPPLQEQKRIVARIEELFSQLDAGVETLKKTKAQLAVYRQAVLKEAFDTVDNETGILGQYIIEKPRNGFSPKPVNYKTKYKNLTLTSTTGGVFKPANYKYIELEIDSESYLWVKHNDILIQRANTIDYVGTAALYTGDDNVYVYPDLMMKCHTIDSVLPQYILYQLHYQQLCGYYRKTATGTSGSMPKINQTTVYNTPIVMTSIDQQQSIVSAIESQLSVCDSIEQTVDAALQQAEAMRQSILKTAFEGSDAF